MPYVLQKGSSYCELDSKGAIGKTQNIKQATIFETQEEAEQKLTRATKKLAGFVILDITEPSKTEESGKVKRKQFSAAERTMIYNRCKGRCAVCGEFMPYDTFTLDHIIPLAKGGTNELDNLQCTCQICNQIKQDILPQNLMKKLTKIMLYQMRKNYDEEVFKKLKRLRKRKKKEQRREKLAKAATVLRKC